MSSLSRSGTWKLSSPKLGATSAMGDVGSIEGPSSTAHTDLLDAALPDSTNLMVERYSKYLSLVKNLESFTDNYLVVLSASTKNHEKLKSKNATEQIPNFESHPGSDVPVSGSTAAVKRAETQDDVVMDVNNFMEALRMKIDFLHTNSQEAESAIKTQVLPEFKKLQEQILTRQKDFIQMSTKEQKELKKLTSASSKEMAKLDDSIQAFEITAERGKVDYHRDPYLINRALLYHAEGQVQKENAHIDFLESNELTLKILESQIMEILKKIFNTLSNILSNYYGSQVNVFQELNTKLSSIPNDLEWEKFKQKNADHLVLSSSTDPGIENAMDQLSLNGVSTGLSKPVFEPAKNSLKRDIDAITYKNKDHQATSPILEGILMKKGGHLSKKYTSAYYVITRSRYLLEFPSRAVDSYQPSLILYLPECFLKDENKDGKFKFIVQGKDISSMLIKTKKNYTFKASSSDEYLTWFNVISEVSGLMHTNAEIRTASLIKSDDEITDDESSTTTAPAPAPATATL
ncbi:hypothetical protein CANARDRAFT_26943 [[Candida] arabinofermentans NRRL YB-2248]|uniref:PH domain-containing protein n=1 Tax=[Candida] arabinofermentans NRRL YB-2248 TaxID=983967 RepID=A0A1E4T738_9ASCO|nr:hypothetical protein CANARDRAFT_26943 [[Candida] arabinofermentans NRRL YB-2248]